VRARLKPVSPGGHAVAARSQDQAAYQAYLDAIAIPLGDKIARIELEKPNPDLDVAHAGFAQGRNHPADIPTLITTFRVFRNVSYIDEAISIWTEGDGLIDQLVADGDRLQGLILDGNPDPAEVDAIVANIGALNDRLTILEDRFSAVLGEGARWVRDLLFIVASAATALLLAIAGRSSSGSSGGSGDRKPLPVTAGGGAGRHRGHGSKRPRGGVQRCRQRIVGRPRTR
jgi:hypothetical protein